MFIVRQHERLIPVELKDRGANVRSSGVACVAVLAEEAAVKQRGCFVSASKQKKICAILAGFDSLSF